MAARALGLAVLGASVLGLAVLEAAAEPPAVGNKNTPTVAAELSAPRIAIASAERTTAANMQWISFACEARNPNQSPLTFVGYRADSFDPPIAEGLISPIYRLEFQRDGQWQPHPIGWCGTGMDGIELPPGATRKFSIAVPFDLAGQVARAGIRWSRPIEFDTAPEGAFQVAWSESFELKLADGPSAKLHGNVVRLVPSGATFEIPKSWPVQAHLTRAELEKVATAEGDWDTEYAAIVNQLLPFSQCAVHLGNDGWGRAGVSYADLQMRCYIVDTSAAKVQAKVMAHGNEWASQYSKEISVTRSNQGKWLKAALTYEVWYGDYGGKANIDVYAQDFGKQAAVLVFMYSDFRPSPTGPIPEILKSFSWEPKEVDGAKEAGNP